MGDEILIHAREGTTGFGAPSSVLDIFLLLHFVVLLVVHTDPFVCTFILNPHPRRRRTMRTASYYCVPPFLPFRFGVELVFESYFAAKRSIENLWDLLLILNCFTNYQP